MENERAKLFVGGISRETGEEDLRAHFKRYGAVLSSLVAKDKTTGAPRGFGFVQFSDSSSADLALGDSHVILGRTVDVKKAVPRSEQHQCQQQQQQCHPYQHKNSGFGNSASDGSGNDCFRNKKVFVGGLPASLTEEQFKNYFERFGRVVDVVVMQDSSTNRPRGFGFITFDSEESVDRVMVNTRHELNGRSVEVKKAVPKDEINASGGSYTSRGGGRKPSNVAVPSGMYSTYGTGYHVPTTYATFPGYSGIAGYPYTTDAYWRSYPIFGYGRSGYGVTPVVPRSPWSGHMMIGPAMCALPYNNAGGYHAYVNDGVSTTGLYNQGIVPSNANLNQVPRGNVHLQASGAPTSSEGFNLEMKASALSISDGSS